MQRPGPTPSPGFGVDEAVARRLAAGEPVLHLASPDAGVPVHPELVERLAAAAHRGGYAPTAGDPAARAAAAGYFERRGLPTEPDRVVLGPGSTALLFAVLAAAPGDVLLPRPCRPCYAAQAALLGRRVHHMPVPAECGGVPDPFALLETVRRTRDEGGEPGALVLSVPDDPTGTVPPPELLHEVCEVAADEGLVVVSDEVWRDLVHDPATVAISPAEMLHGRTVVITGLSASLGLGGWRIGVARFPEGDPGDQLLRGALLAAGHVWSGPAAPVQEAAAHALSEPPALREHIAAAARLHRAVVNEVRRLLTLAGALCRPPDAGFHLYPDLAPLRAPLAERGVTDAASLERHLLEALGVAVLGGHRLGDDPSELRFLASTGLLHGETDAQRWAALRAGDPLQVPHVAEALTRLGAVFTGLTGG